MSESRTRAEALEALYRQLAAAQGQSNVSPPIQTRLATPSAEDTILQMREMLNLKTAPAAPHQTPPAYQPPPHPVPAMTQAPIQGYATRAYQPPSSHQQTPFHNNSTPFQAPMYQHQSSPPTATPNPFQAHVPPLGHHQMPPTLPTTTIPLPTPAPPVYPQPTQYQQQSHPMLAASIPLQASVHPVHQQPIQQPPAARSESQLRVEYLEAQIAQLQAAHAQAEKAQREEALYEQLHARGSTQPQVDLLQMLTQQLAQQNQVPGGSPQIDVLLAQLLTSAAVNTAPPTYASQQPLPPMYASQQPPPAFEERKQGNAPNSRRYNSSKSKDTFNGDKRNNQKHGTADHNRSPAKTPPKPVVKQKIQIQDQICRYFNTPGGCNLKDKCPRKHIVDVKAQNDRAKDAADFATIQEELRANVAKVRVEMKAKYDQANRLDLVIVMDCTSSMGRWIASAKDAVRSIIVNIQSDHPNASIRIGFIGYRDYVNGDLRIESIQFTSDVDRVYEFITKLKARGGCGNFADVPGGIAEALGMKWEADAKVIILVGDAPCHGKLYHDNYNGTMNPATPCIREQMRTIARAGIDFRFIEIDPANTAKMVAILQAEYASTIASDGIERSFAAVPLSAPDDVLKFGDVVRQVGSSSLQASKSRSVVFSAQNMVNPSQFSTALEKIGEDDEEDDDDKPIVIAEESTEWTPPTTTKALNWDEVEACPEIAAIRHSVFIRPECTNLANPTTIHTTQATSVKLISTPFAKGTMRTAHGMIDCKLKLRLVAKFYFGSAAAMAHHVRNDVEMHAVAKRLASEFSKSPYVEDGVDFILTCWYEIKGRPLFTAEPHIDGEYHKYNNNNGWVQNASNDQVATAQAFSHFTYAHSLGKLLVCDLQGVGSIYTDPQIHAVDMTKYGQGNLGPAGIMSFFASHSCNHICNALRLMPMDGTSLPPVDSISPKALADKTMTCSCPLCGVIYTMLHSGFVAELQKYPELYCPSCLVQYNKSKSAIPCIVCGVSREYSLYWYEMKGMETPKYCKECKSNKPKGKKSWQYVVRRAMALAMQPDGWAQLNQIGNKIKQVDATFSVKDHAPGLIELLRLLPNVELREQRLSAGVTHFARWK